MKIKFFSVLSLALFTVVSGCGSKKESEAPLPATVAPPSVAVSKTLDRSTLGNLKGVVKFEGAVPATREIPVKGNPECAVFHSGGTIRSEELLVKDGVLQNAFVYIKEGLEGYQFDVPQEAVTVSNKNCVYVPHVSGVRAGQPLILSNEDPTLHNIHAYSKNSPAFNLGLPFQGIKQTKKFSSPEVMVTLKCDVHPWMIGYVGVLPHPYFAVTGEEGTFELKDLPPGEYTVEVWHEKLGTQSQKIQIGPRETKETEFKFSA